jgi:hypothetical protein
MTATIYEIMRNTNEKPVVRISFLPFLLKNQTASKARC